MSDYILKIIPADPYVKISEDVLCEVKEYLYKNTDCERIDTSISLYPDFIDCGGNLESISCPECGTIIDFDWWGNAVDKASNEHFSDLSVKMPCCGTKISLNDLNYDMKCGFASCEICIMNPYRLLEDDVINEIQRKLGTEIVLIHSNI